jgi:probable rRNA maturation factor
MTAIDFSFRAGRAHEPFLRKQLPRAARLVRRCPREVSIAVVGDATMSRLHERFLSIPGPTDVLTFELEHNAKGHCTAGEIVVCAPYALRTARSLGTAPQNELLLYCLHGLLHLTGYDDRDDSAFRRMHAEEDRILSFIGIGKVFDSPRKRTARSELRR